MNVGYSTFAGKKTFLLIFFRMFLLKTVREEAESKARCYERRLQWGIQDLTLGGVEGAWTLSMGVGGGKSLKVLTVESQFFSVF